MKLLSIIKSIIIGFRRKMAILGIRHKTLGALILAICSLTACTDKDLDINTDSSRYDNDNPPSLSIKFPLYLDVVSDSRAGSSVQNDIDKYDNYIDTQNMLQVLFLTADGDFLFQPSFTVEETPDRNGQWYITANLDTSIQDDDGVSVLSLVKDYLEENPFKIAILANWNDRGSEKKVDWGWKESKLNTTVMTPANINDLHHITGDSYYSADSRKNAYLGTIMSDDLKEMSDDGKSIYYKMGFNSEWVQYRDVYGEESIGNDQTVESAWRSTNNIDNSQTISDFPYGWIKNNWDPELDINTSGDNNTHGIYRHYSQLWQLWNFGAGVDNTAYTYSDWGVKSGFSDKWGARNWSNQDNGVEGFQTWIDKDNKVIEYAKLGVTGQSGLESYGIGERTIDGLTIVTKGKADEIIENPENYIRSFRKSVGGNLYCGVVIPEWNPDAEHTPGTEIIKVSSQYASEYMKFAIPGTGKLRIAFSSLDGRDATLVVQRGVTKLASFTAPTLTMSGQNIQGIPKKEIGSKTNEIFDFTTSMDKNSKNGLTIKITEDSEDIILFCVKGSVVIYGIEFVCDDYLQGTDREGIIPNASQPIPMYGVQHYSSIDSWGSQEILELSPRISLIRALAKVELYLPKGGNSIKHVYLRSMNRKARLEPMDVLSNTGDLWNEHVDGGCEWFRIQKHGTYYHDGTFNDWFGWFFGSWNSWNWNNKGSTNLPTSFTDERESPNLFNPDVQRSDFCHFIEDRNYQGNYHRFILYVPDKNISDPNTEGNLSSSTKVCHIEYRYAGNSDYLDDNSCYRIYFTDYTKNSDIKATKFNEFETVYEKDKDKLDQLWPIMRNHKYIFYVGGDNTPQEIRVKVLDWNEEEPAHKEIW